MFWNYHDDNYKLKTKKSFAKLALLRIEEMSREVIIGHNVRHIKKELDQEHGEPVISSGPVGEPNTSAGQDRVGS